MRSSSFWLRHAVGIACAFTMGCTGTEIIDTDDPNEQADLVSQNLLSNPSFEIDTRHWSSYQGTISRVALYDAPSGRYAAKVARRTGASFSIDDYPGEVRPAAAGLTYRASAQVRTATATTGRPLFIVIREYAASGAVVRQTSSAALLLGARFQTISVAATTTQVNGRLNVYVYQGGAVAGDAFFIDAISLVQTGIVAPADMGSTPSADLATTPSADLATTAPDLGPSPVTRDPLKWPFASTSIWNMPIGSGAVYVPSHLLENSNPSNNIWAPFPGMDEEHIVLTPTAPMTPVYYNGAGWSGGDRCAGGSGSPRTSVPIPSNYVVPNGGGNSSAVFLMPDNRTLMQMQPLARCTAGSYATSYAFFPSVDLYGDGIRGAHGGSGLSAFGGSIRMGEMRPGSQGPRHALKVAVYAKSALYRCTTGSQCYRWPAVTGDGYAVGWYGSNNNNANAAMKMGALLAIPPSVNIASLGLETEPGHQLAWTMQNYGAYIDDDMYGSPGILLDTETGPAGRKADEFKSDYGFTFLQRENVQTPWLRDIKRIMGALSVVDNNGPTSIGGGGTPRQPLAPPITP